MSTKRSIKAGARKFVVWLPRPEANPATALRGLPSQGTTGGRGIRAAPCLLPTHDPPHTMVIILRRRTNFLLATAILSVATLASCSKADPKQPVVAFGVADSSLMRFSWMEQTSSHSGYSIMNAIPVSGGRFVGLDMRKSAIVIFSGDGTLEGTAGRPGRGPGDLGAVCCLALAPGDSNAVWVYELANARYTKFNVSGVRPVYVTSIVAPPNGGPAGNGVAIDQNHVIRHVRALAPAPSGLVDRLVLKLDTTGREVGRDTIAAPQGTSIPAHWVQRSSGPGGGTAIGILQPHGPVQLFAISGDGTVAQAVSSAYHIEVILPNGSKQTIELPGQFGPSLSADEATKARESIDAQAKSAGITSSEVPFGVPSNKPVLRAIEFDALGRLWVIMTPAARAPVMADVYLPNGIRFGRFSWPHGWRLGVRPLSALEGLAWSRDSSGFEEIHRIRFGPRRP